MTYLDGGLTNTNVRVDTADADVVVRISSEDSSMLAIDREAEYHNSKAAAESGASPARRRVSSRTTTCSWSSTSTARPTTPDDLRDSANLAARRRCGAARCTRARASSASSTCSTSSATSTPCRTAAYRLPDRYLDFMPQVEQMRKRAVDAVRSRTVPCNNDLLAANFLDDGERLWIIDFEYAGNNDPCFELGNIWSESNLDLHAARRAHHRTTTDASSRAWSPGRGCSA